MRRSRLPAGVERIPLGNHEFEGRNNAYLLAGGGETALVDTGVATEAVREQLAAGLAEHGVGFADLDAVVLTHWHYDHAGLAGELQAASGATVYAHGADAPLVEHDERALEDLRDRQRARFREWGMPPTKREELLAFFEGSADLAGEPADVTVLADGEVVEVAGRALQVLHAPGHTAGLVCLAFEGEQGAEAFVGDAVLPVYTPNVGGADVRVDRPLATYARTLEALVARNLARVWPGHRDPIDDPAGRARVILDHHRDRTRRVLDALDEAEPRDAWTVSAALFGDLEGIHVMHGPGEAWAHLDHLEHHGLVERTAAGYRLATPADEARVPPLT